MFLLGIKLITKSVHNIKPHHHNTKTFSGAFH